MQPAFDPYYRWLGIPAEEQPPNYYRLLGLRVFEADRDVIGSAADRQMRHVQTFKAGQHSAVSQQVLNELSQARLCLLRPDTKAAYDRQLQAALDAKTAAASPAKAQPLRRAVPLEESSPEGPTIVPEGFAGAIEVGPLQPISRPSQRRPPWLLAAGGVIAACLVAAVALLAWRSQPVRPELAPLPDQAVDEGKSLEMDILASRKPEVPWIYEIVAPSPAGMQIDRQTGKLTWVPSESQGGQTHEIRVRAAVAGAPELFGESSFTVTVREQHQPPRFDDVLLPLPSDGQLAAQLQARDQDQPSGKLVYSFGVDPTPASPPELDAATGEFVWRPSSDDYGKRYQFTFRAAKSEAPQMARVQTVDFGLPSQRQFWEAKLAAAGVQAQHLSTTPRGAEGGLMNSYRLNQQPALVFEFDSAEQAMQWDLGEPATAAIRQQIPIVKQVAVYRDDHRIVAVGAEDQALAGVLSRLMGQPLRVIPPGPLPPTAPSAPAVAPAGRPPLNYETLASLLQPAARQRPAMPDEAARKKAAQTMKDVFAEQFKSRKTQDRLALAGLLFTEAEKPNCDPISRYVLLEESSKLATEAKDVTVSWKALDRLIDEFDVDGLKLKQEALTKATPPPLTSAVHLVVANSNRQLAEQVAKEARFEEAVSLMLSAAKSADKAKNVKLEGECKERLRELRGAKEAYTKAQAALATLKTTPGDAQANQDLGGYLCFWSDHWPEGLPLLAKAPKGSLATAARLDLAEPVEPQGRVAAGDAWRKAGDELRAPEQRPLLMRARHWYDLARPQLTSLEQSALDKKLQGLPQPAAPPAAAVVVPAPQANAAAGVQVTLPPPLAAGDRNLDRLAATVVLRLEGSVNVAAANGTTLSVQQEAQLPTEAFVVQSVRFKNRLSDQPLVYLQHLKYVESISCGLNTTVTDSGIANLQNLQSLKSFSNTSNGGQRLTDATLAVLGKLPNLETVRITNARFTDQGIAQLSGLRKLSNLDCPAALCTDAVFPHVGRIGSLKTLSLGGQMNSSGLIQLDSLANLSSLTLKSDSLGASAQAGLARLTRLQSLTLEGNFPDALLEPIGKLTSLTQLSLGSPNITAAGVERLSNLGSLTSLTFTARGGPLSDPMLGALPKLPLLQNLFVHRAEQLTDKGLTPLALQPRLSNLTLQNARLLTNAAVPHLGRISSLRTLYLHDTQLNDTGLAQFRGATQLQSLGLTNSQVTDQGVQSLKQLLPQCNIFK